MWKQELATLYSRNYGGSDNRIRHVAEQTALNVLIARHDLAIQVDPLFNYMCMFGLPFRDAAGTVRVLLPPNMPVNTVHLSSWRANGKLYFDRGLLFDSGRYLSDDEKKSLLALVVEER